MQLFETFHNKYRMVGIDPKQHSFDGKMIVTSLILVGSISFCVLYLPESKSFGELTECVYIASAVCTVVASYLSAIIQIVKVFKYTSDCEKFVNERIKNYALESLYAETSRQIGFWSKIIYLVVAKMSPLAFTLPKFIFSILIYAMSNFKNSAAFELPFPMWFPFDTEKPFGYIEATALQYIITIYAFSAVSCLVTLGIGAFIFAIAATEDIMKILKLLDKCAKREPTQPKAYKLLSEFIYIHATVKQLFLDFADIFQPIFMAIFTWSLMTICNTMLMFQTEISHGDYFTVILFATIVEAFYAFGIIFVVCELSQRASNAFEEIDSKIGGIGWYLLPEGVKRMLPTIISNLHRPVVLKCFGSTLCSREAFKMVVNSGFSYFMVLRQFGSK